MDSEYKVNPLWINSFLTVLFIILLRFAGWVLWEEGWPVIEIKHKHCVEFHCVHNKLKIQSSP